MVDQFTKWVECVPLPSQTAEQTARGAVREFFSRFGYPFAILHRSGAEFRGATFLRSCVRCWPFIRRRLRLIARPPTVRWRGISGRWWTRSGAMWVRPKTSGTNICPNSREPYGLQSIGVPDLRQIGSCLGGKWTSLPTCCTRHRVGQSPKIWASIAPGLREAMGRAQETARGTLRAQQKRRKRDYDVHLYRRQYSEGDLVYILDTAKIKGVCKKLSPPWKGPARIAQRMSPRSVPGTDTETGISPGLVPPLWRFGLPFTRHVTSRN